MSDRCYSCGAPHPFGSNCHDVASMWAKRWEGGGVIKGSGNSHITIDNGSAHITTEIPKMRQDDKITDRFDVDDR